MTNEEGSDFLFLPPRWWRSWFRSQVAGSRTSGDHWPSSANQEYWLSGFEVGLALALHHPIWADEYQNEIEKLFPGYRDAIEAQQVRSLIARTDPEHPHWENYKR